MLHDGGSYDTIQGQGHGGPKVVKMVDPMLVCMYSND